MKGRSLTPHPPSSLPPSNFNSRNRLQELQVGVCLQVLHVCAMNHINPHIRMWMNTIGPLSCSPVFRLRGIYPRFSSNFTCMFLRHTDTHSILNNTDFRKTFPIFGSTPGCGPPTIKQPCCLGLKMPRCQFRFLPFRWMLKENKYTSIIISTSSKEAWAWSTFFPLLTRDSTVSSRPYASLLCNLVMAGPCPFQRKVP